MAEVTPLLRSRLLSELLALLLLEKGPWTAEELAARTGAAYPTVTKEVRRLQQSGFLQVRTVGRQKLLAPDRSDAVVRAMTRLLQAAPADDREAKGGGVVAKKKDKDKKGKKKK